MSRYTFCKRIGAVMVSVLASGGRSWTVSVSYHNRYLIKRIQSGHHPHLIESNLFSPWYSWKIAHLAL